MKKLVLSTIALVAFSFAGMANHSVENDLTKEELLLVSDTPCADKWELTYYGLRDLGYSHDYSNGYADSIFNQYMDETYGPETLSISIE